MRISQYTYFAVKSTTLCPAAIAERLGLEPDESSVMGERSAEHTLPRAHLWALACRESGKTVDSQVEDVIGRLTSAQSALRALLRDVPNTSGVLQVVRYFDDPAGEEDDTTPTPEGLVKLEGQHHLLGWHVDAAILEFLVDVGAELDVDEYG
jgi:hypothetical protein